MKGSKEIVVYRQDKKILESQCRVHAGFIYVDDI